MRGQFGDLAVTERPVATELLSRYQGDGDSLFASPHGTLLTSGVASRLPDGTADDLPRRIAALLEGAEPGAVAIGALPFAPGGRAEIHRPVRVRRGGPSRVHRRDPRPEPFDATLRPVPEPAVYAAAVDAVVRRLRGGDADKVVLARALDIVAEEALDLPAMVRRLAARDPQAFTFAIALEDGRTLLGASPELLVARRGDLVTCHPLAGSAKRAGSPALDRQRGHSLLASEKDRYEHALVVDAIRRGLEPVCAELDVPESPRLVTTHALWHLGTQIVGRLADPATTASELAQRLHPTPAICGHPTDRAREMIAEIEPFDRELYAGAVGWQDASGDGEWAVTIRCAVADGRRLRLYAGAGLVDGSRGDSELAETTAKLQTFLSAVGLDAPGASS